MGSYSGRVMAGLAATCEHLLVGVAAQPAATMEMPRDGEEPLGAVLMFYFRGEQIDPPAHLVADWDRLDEGLRDQLHMGEGEDAKVKRPPVYRERVVLVGLLSGVRVEFESHTFEVITVASVWNVLANQDCPKCSSKLHAHDMKAGQLVCP
jgi:hypothetical protein